MYIIELAKTHDIIFIQETWLANNNELAKTITKHGLPFKAYHKATKRTSIRGRQPGGIAWLVRDNISKLTKCTFLSERLSTLELGDSALIGIYGHFDDGKPETLVESGIGIETALRTARELERLGKSTFILGDFNADPGRGRRNDKLVCNAIADEGRLLADTLYLQQIGHTFMSGAGTSWIDHVAVNNNNKQLQQVNILNDATNLSDHRALSIAIASIMGTATVNPMSRRQVTKANNWKDEYFRADYNNFLKANIINMDSIMRTLRIEGEAKRVKTLLDETINELHSQQRRAIEQALEMRAKRAQINTSRHLRSKRWWHPEVERAYKEKVLAFNEWKASCFQDEASRARYRASKKAFSVAQKLNESLAASAKFKRVEQLFRGDRSAMWAMIKDMTKPATANIDIEKLDNEFRDTFSAKLRENALAEHEAMEAVDNFLRVHAANRERTPSDWRLCTRDVEEVLATLSSGKATGFSGMASEAYKFGSCPRLVMLVKLVVEKMFHHNIIPHLFNVGLIMPIIKDARQDHSDLANVRPITVSDTLANVYERLVLREFERVWPNSGKQFGFKKNSSCSHAIFTLRETALLKMKTRGGVHVCAIDASKAFDKLNRAILWAKMIGRIDDDILANLINYYGCAHALIVTKDSYSTMFRTSLGVKQGGPLSPRLFAAYLEGLVDNIEVSGLGVRVGAKLVNVLLYADDIILVANSVGELQSLVKITEEYGKAHEMAFNPKKTVYAQFGGEASAQTLQLDGSNISRSDELKYLGVTFSPKLTPTLHLSTRKRAAMARMSALRTIGIDSPHISVPLRLFMYKTYVRPILLYGVETQSLNKEQTRELQVFESSIVKRLVGISKYCRSTLLIYATSLDRIEERVACAKLDLIGRLDTNSDTRDTTTAILEAYEATKSKKQHRLSILSEVKSLAHSTTNDFRQLSQESRRVRKEIACDVQAKQRSEEVLSIRTIINDSTITDYSRAEALSRALHAG